MRLHLPGRATVLDQLKLGACFLIPTEVGVEVGLMVCDRGQSGALMLGRRSGHGGTALVVIPEERLSPDVFELPDATLAPHPTHANFAFGIANPNLVPWALHLGDGCAFLRARGTDGKLRAYEVASGKPSAIDLAYLPWAGRWRIMVPDADGAVQTLFTAGADASSAPRETPPILAANAP